MAGQKLDGAGVQKLKTLEEATIQLQRLHGIVETYAMTLKRSQPTMHYSMQIRRALPPMIGLLKGQFGTISDQIAGINLIASRGGNENTKVRVLREGVASLRVALEFAAKKVTEQHAVKEEKSQAEPEAEGPLPDAGAPSATPMNSA